LILIIQIHNIIVIDNNYIYPTMETSILGVIFCITRQGEHVELTIFQTKVWPLLERQSELLNYWGSVSTQIRLLLNEHTVYYDVPNLGK